MKMMSRHLARLGLSGLSLCFAVPSTVHAQASIAGVITDASAAVLPGVTVEASSPALIERVRSAVTDKTGHYKIEQLRPGVYAVTFTLAGFNVVRREGIELTGSSVATVNAVLRIGSLKETITVMEESVKVDVQSVMQQRVMNAEAIAALPTGRTMFTVSTLIPGVSTTTADVGATNNLALTNNVTVHGSRDTDTRVLIDGLSASSSEGAGQQPSIVPDMGAAQEVVVDTAGGSAERAYGGLRINIIPKEGGNAFSGSFFASGTNGKFQGSNYSEDLRRQGLGTPNRLHRVYAFNAGVGGPLIRDKLWFYSSTQQHTNQLVVAGKFHNLNRGKLDKWTYEPDLSRRAIYDTTLGGINTRLTWQAAKKHKLGVFYEHQWKHQPLGTSPRAGLTASPEAVNDLPFPKLETASLSWTSPQSSRLLLEARASIRAEAYTVNPDYEEGRKFIGVVEQSINFSYRGRAAAPPFWELNGRMSIISGAVSYVTGAHAFKVGVEDRWGYRESTFRDNDYALSYRFNNGMPNLLTQRALPVGFVERENLNSELGIYAQDRWTIGRLTLNAGVRFDSLKTDYPEMHMGPALLAPTRDVTLPYTPWLNWKDVTPRLGVAYDLFGTGKTAVKVSMNKYVIAQGLQGPYGELASTVQRQAWVVTRSWADANRNFVPDCDLVNVFANGECGTVSDTNFGNAKPTTTYDPESITGWNNRPNDWEFSASVQHQLFPRMSVYVGVFRRTYGNLTLIDNRAVAPSDYSTFSLTAPVDPRLPAGGGDQITGLYDLNPDKVGQVDNYFTLARNYGKQTEHWNGMDATVNLRLPRGVLLQGGMSIGRTSVNNCDVVSKVDNPSTRFCDSLDTRPQAVGRPPADTGLLKQVKVQAVYPIPKIDVQVAGVFESLPGPVIFANYVAANALVAPSLGRPLSGNAPNVTVNLVEPGSMHGRQANRIDLRLTKNLRFGGSRIGVHFDVYNLLNANTVTALNNSYAVWQQPQEIMLARFAKLGVQVDF
jgi:hypothetical protein